MAQKQQRGIDLMKKVSDKQAADLRQLAMDNARNMKKRGKRPAM